MTASPPLPPLTRPLASLAVPHRVTLRPSLSLEMKLLMDLCKQMNVEMGNPRKLVPECQGLSSGNMPGKGNQEGKQPMLLQAQHFMNNSAENKPPTIPFSSEKQASNGQLRGSYILGERMNGTTETLLLLAKPALPNSTCQTWHM
uniref:Uncharacterized protein n=1 Tax=Fagus sylvatica TaxID=28930 RepID=A0A2N9HG73_FAGSY